MFLNLTIVWFQPVANMLANTQQYFKCEEVTPSCRREVNKNLEKLLLPIWNTATQRAIIG